jgi:hypothetical protein
MFKTLDFSEPPSNPQLDVAGCNARIREDRQGSYRFLLTFKQKPRR